MAKKILEEIGEFNGKKLYSVRFEETEEEKVIEKEKGEKISGSLDQMLQLLDQMHSILDSDKK